ncbi:MAG: glycosyltransferase [Sedimentisphaerales bacterium]|jgi:glycosyltransferase involved in cell wall biosynthesis|nr:glycosyltransferase [Sedimentisphaerales bacterium]
MSTIRRIASYGLLVSVYAVTWLVAVVGYAIPRRRWKPNGRILVTGTFFNPNWYLSHILPLARSGLEEVLLIVDEAQQPIEKVRFLCPPRWLAVLTTRAVAKAVWMIIAGIRYRPDLYMGYHLMPGSCSALLAGRLLGRPACYQMTGGPVEIVGGGYGAIDSPESALGRPSRLIESLATKVVRQFDLVVVRGNQAKRFLEARHPKGTVAIITGSINGSARSSRHDRLVHLVFCGRLSPIKQVHQFIALVDRVRCVIPGVRAEILGDGPLKAELQAYARQLGLTENIAFLGKTGDVQSHMVRSRVFILTSMSEGLSIAMAEAMSAGVVPVVAEIGELGDLVKDGENGYLVRPNCTEEYAARTLSLLRDEALWQQLSRKAIEAARSYCDIETVSEKWRRHIQGTVARASGHPRQHDVR